MSDQQIENGEPRVITDSEGLMAQFVEVPLKSAKTSNRSWEASIELRISNLI